MGLSDEELSKTAWMLITGWDHEFDASVNVKGQVLDMFIRIRNAAMEEAASECEHMNDCYAGCSESHATAIRSKYKEPK